MMMNKRRTQRKVTKPLTHLQKLNLKRGAIMFCFKGLISNCGGWVIYNHLSKELQGRMRYVVYELQAIEALALRDTQKELEAEKQRINDAVKEIMNEPDASN